MEACKDLPIVFLNPLEKETDPKTKKWKNLPLTEEQKEERSRSQRQSPWWYMDKYAIKIADIIFVNAEDYGREEGRFRGTGDVFEMGMAFMADKLVILVNQVEHRYYREFERIFTSFKTLEEGIKHLRKCVWLANH